MDATLVGFTGALVTGAASSLHCSLMCGPLACAALSPGERRVRTGAAWHAGRLGAYASVGAVLGTAGAGVATTLTAVQPWLPWVMAGALLFTALDLGKRLPPLPGLARVAAVVSRLGARFSSPVRGAALGLATPFLPCGLLYGVMVGALAAGSPLGGAAVMGGFALGGVPALAAVQAQAGWMTGRPLAALALKRVLPAVAAGVLTWRAVVVPQADAAQLRAPPSIPEASSSPAERAPAPHRCH